MPIVNEPNLEPEKNATVVIESSLEPEKNTTAITVEPNLYCEENAMVTVNEPNLDPEKMKTHADVNLHSRRKSYSLAMKESCSCPRSMCKLGSCVCKR